MTPQELVGLRIQMLRRAFREDEDGSTRRMSQKELGERLGDYLGKPWSNQAVSEAEKGLRAFRLPEMLAIAEVLHTNIQHLLTPLHPEDVIEISDEHTMTGDEVAFAVGTEPALTAGANALVEHLNEKMQAVLASRLGENFITAEERHELIRERDVLQRKVASLEAAEAAELLGGSFTAETEDPDDVKAEG